MPLLSLPTLLPCHDLSTDPGKPISASVAPSAGSAGTRAAPKTPASWQPSAGQSQNAAPPPAGSPLQSEPQNEPERTAPRPSSPGPCRFPTKAICCRIFTPALPVHPAASVRDFCSADYSVPMLSAPVLRRRHLFDGSDDKAFVGVGGAATGACPVAAATNEGLVRFQKAVQRTQRIIVQPVA